MILFFLLFSSIFFSWDSQIDLVVWIIYRHRSLSIRYTFGDDNENVYRFIFVCGPHLVNKNSILTFLLLLLLLLFSFIHISMEIGYDFSYTFVNQPFFSIFRIFEWIYQKLKRSNLLFRFMRHSSRMGIKEWKNFAMYKQYDTCIHTLVYK